MTLDPLMYAYGYDTRHDASFVVDRPGPRKSWVISCFGSPVRILTAKGIETGQPGDCFVLEPSFPEWYTTVPGEAEGYRNDWMHIESDSMEQTVRDLRIPRNLLIPTGNPRLITDILKEMTEEDECKQAYWKEAISQAIRKALLRIARAGDRRVVEESWSISDLRYRKKFSGIRAVMRQNHGRKWTIEELAGEANLSPSRFSVLYLKFFKTSPIEDLIQARLSYACRRLLTSDVTLESLSSECGFGDAAYLCRAFTKRIGCTPGAYRNLSHGKEEARVRDAVSTAEPQAHRRARPIQ